MCLGPIFLTSPPTYGGKSKASLSLKKRVKHIT